MPLRMDCYCDDEECEAIHTFWQILIMFILICIAGAASNFAARGKIHWLWQLYTNMCLIILWRNILYITLECAASVHERTMVYFITAIATDIRRSSWRFVYAARRVTVLFSRHIVGHVRHSFPMTASARRLAEYSCVNIPTIVIGTASEFLLHKICASLFSFFSSGRKWDAGEIIVTQPFRADQRIPSACHLLSSLV